MTIERQEYEGPRVLQCHIPYELRTCYNSQRRILTRELTVLGSGQLKCDVLSATQSATPWITATLNRVVYRLAPVEDRNHWSQVL